MSRVGKYLTKKKEEFGKYHKNKERTKEEAISARVELKELRSLEKDRAAIRELKEHRLKKNPFVRLTTNLTNVTQKSHERKRLFNVPTSHPDMFGNMFPRQERKTKKTKRRKKKKK